MTYITIKTKKTNANVEIFPPIVLDGRSHISLVDIRIPEEETKSFTFTERQAIYIEPSKGDQPKMTVFPKGVYNIYKIQYKINTSPLVEYIDLNIATLNFNNINIETKSNAIKFSPELAKTLGIPKTLPPFSHIKISGDEKYLINCNLVEKRSSYASQREQSSLSFETSVYPSNLLAIAPSRDGRYPELTIQSVNKIINNLTLEILTENLETPDFGDKEIIYILKVC